MAQRLKVTYTDGREVEVLAGPKAEVALERQFNLELIGKTPEKVEHVYYLAWAALHFAGKEPKGFDDFLDVLADVDALADEPVDPTPQGQPPVS